MNLPRLLFFSLILSITAGASIFLGSIPSQTGADATPEGMVLVRSGSYTPFFDVGSEVGTVEVQAFYLDETAVTNADFLQFVQENERWRRSNVPGIFADERYLQHWSGDLDFDSELANRPVVNVSWFAAQAYADWVGKRLPTTAEWEYAASASESMKDGSKDPEFGRKILEWYSRPARTNDVRTIARNAHGVWDMHGLIWEWVDDFNESLVSGDSRENIDMDLKLFCGSGAVDATDGYDYPGFIRFAFRGGLEGNYTVTSLGFRLAKDVPPV